MVADRQENYEKNAGSNQAEIKKKKRENEASQVEKEIKYVPARRADFHSPKSG